MSFRAAVRARLPFSAEAGRRDAVLAGLLALFALAVRLYGITDRMFSHPENFVAGVPMPEWVVPPSRRVDLASLYLGTLEDGHPPLYFAFMLFWTKLFGHGLFALRLPSALAGAASVLVVHRLGLRLLRDRGGALLAAALVALHGFHVYWSQFARPYALAALLVLLSTLLLLTVEERGGKSAALAYGGVTTAALWTQLYAWPVVFVHVLWLAWRSLRWRYLPAAAPPLLGALVLAMPVVALALHQNPGNRWNQSPWTYFAFGHTLSAVGGFRGEAVQPSLGPAAWSLVVLTLLLVGAGALAARTRPTALTAEPAAAACPKGRACFGVLAAVTLLSTGLIAWFAATVDPLRASARSLLLACAALPPLLALVGGIWSGFVARGRPTPAAGARERRVLLAALALLPLIAMVAVSRFRGVLVVRGTVVFVPFLLLAVTAGVVALRRTRWLSAAACAATLLLAAMSIGIFREAAGTRNDSRGLATALAVQLRPGDLVLVSNDYRTSALLYNFPPEQRRQFAALDDGPARLAERPRRVWIVRWNEEPPHSPEWDEMEGFALAGEVRGERHAAAARYER